MLSEVLLHCTPKELNKIEFTVIFWEHDTEVSGSLNCLMDEGFLFLEIWLQIKNPFGTAICCIGVTIWVLSVHLQSGLEKTSLSKDLLHPFWFVWVLWVIC